MKCPNQASPRSPSRRADMMRVLSAAELLDVWEHGLKQPLTRRALTILAAACPDVSVEDLAALPVGRRDARLLQLRGWLFGSEVTIVAMCPSCGEQIESTFQIDAARVVDDQLTEAHYSVNVNGYGVTFRSPASSDLLVLSASGAGRSTLLERCLLEVRRPDGEVIKADPLPDHIVAAVVEHMATADPQADVEISLTCPACEHRWLAMFDIASFFWKEIHAWAQRTLRDVHSLARAYGWREADVLSLSPTRRQIYLELARQ